jgi:uncharacterized protein (DUF362 family)
VIKPNVLRSSSAEEHIVTHPQLLRAVVEKIEQMSPADIVVGDKTHGLTVMTGPSRTATGSCQVRKKRGCIKSPAHRSASMT